MASKKKPDLAAELASSRRAKLETLTFRCDAETKALLDALVERAGARGVGEVIRHAVRRLAKDEGLLG